MQVNWQAKWIWHADEESPRNAYWCSRKSFGIPSGAGRVRALVSADSRYSLWVNGIYIGHGPLRGFAHNWRYDEYDITPHVQSGTNTIAVLVQHYGHSTFQYVQARGGLLAQVECDERIVAATDSTWRGAMHPSYNSRTVRMCCQQAWAEDFDARLEPLGWTGIDFDDSGWKSAVVVGEVGCKPWTKVSPRDIPFLTQAPVYPTRLVNMRLVKPPKQVWSMDFKPNLAPGDLSANAHRTPGLVTTLIQCSCGMCISICAFRNQFVATFIDGREVSCKELERGIELEAGEHLFAVDTSGIDFHEWFATLVFDYGDGELTLRSPLAGAEYPFASVGPFEQDESAREAALTLATAKDVSAHPKSRPIDPDHTDAACVSPLTERASAVDGRAHVIDPDAMLAANENITTVYASPSGDTEVVIDFGEEVVGFVELDLCAPQGTVIDFNGFENIQDGRIQWPGAWMSNTFRYTTRAGWQSWRSVVRRGFHYASVTLRFPEGCSEPITFKSIRCYANTYPYANRGLFDGSDALLNKVWEISRRTVRLCSEDTFVDCPAFEQAFWVGDARNESLFAYMAFGDYKLARRCLLLAGESLFRSPLVESQVPSGWSNILPAWSLLWTIACEEHYQYTSDWAFLEQIYPAVALQNANIYDRFINSSGLFEITGWNMLDWAPMDTPASGVVTHQNMWLVECLKRSVKMATILGHTDDAEKFAKQADALRDAVVEHLWDDKNQAFIDCIHPNQVRSRVLSQQTQTVAYLCDVMPEGQAERFVGYLTDVPYGWVKVGSPFMMAFTIEALHKAGDVQSILGLIRRWWGLMIQSGDTTCWETFPGSVSDVWNTRSYCHAWSAAPAYALPAYVLGVRPIEPGFGSFEVRPNLCDLQHAHGLVPTPHGEIQTEVRRDGDSTLLSIVVPPGTTAVIESLTYPQGSHTTRVSDGVQSPQVLRSEHE
ncbi:MAG: family 78 glycoside hydrolase catalytic domain [Armatimonadota bacterium]